MEFWICISMILGYALVFFIMALWETRNIKDAFDMWMQAMKEWKRHAIAGLIFLIILLLIGISIGG